MPNDNQDRLRAAVGKRQATDQARDAAAERRSPPQEEQHQLKRLQQLQAQGQQLAILINNQAIAQSQALRNAGGLDRFQFTPDAPDQFSVSAWRVCVAIHNGRPRGPFGSPGLRISLARSGALIATWPGTRVQSTGEGYRQEEIILVQDDPAQPLAAQIEDLLITLYERVVKAEEVA